MDNSNASTAETQLLIEQDGTGDAVLGWTITGATSWQAYVDNSDSDKWKLRRSTSDFLTVTEAGLVHVTNELTAGTKTFRIDHPLAEKKDTHQLVHSCIEAPKADLIYRGTTDLSDGWIQVDLDEAAGMSAGTWELLCRDPQCWIQNDSGWSGVRGSVEGNTLTIECEDTSSSDSVSWMVVAERCDPHIMEVGWTDDEGHPTLEP